MSEEFTFTRPTDCVGQKCNVCDRDEREARAKWDEERAKKVERAPFVYGGIKCSDTCKGCEQWEAQGRAAYDAETARLSAAENKGSDMYAVKLTGYGKNKIATIKLVRECTSDGLKDAKDKAEAASADAPLTVFTCVSRELADDIAFKFYVAAGEYEPQVYVSRMEEIKTYDFMRKKETYSVELTAQDVIALQRGQGGGYYAPGIPDILRRCALDDAKRNS